MKATLYTNLKPKLKIKKIKGWGRRKKKHKKNKKNQYCNETKNNKTQKKFK